MNKLRIAILGLLSILSGEFFAQTNVFPASGDVGIGTVNPLAAFHVMKEDTGIKSQFSMTMFEAIDAQLDIVSSSAGTWGSAINFIEGNGVSNTNVWSLARQTTAGSGDSSLRINYGVHNSHDNPSLVTFKSNGHVGVGTTSPNEKLEVNGNVLLTTDPASSANNLSNSTSLRLVSSGYATDGRTRYQDWKIQAIARSTWGSGDIVFFSNTDGVGYNERFRLMNDGKVGIGTASPDAKLTVKGNIHAEEVKVDLSVPGPDYVFKEDYDLMSLAEIQSYINEHGHLPNIPSAKEMEKNGIQLGEMNMKLLEKIEELTLYILLEEQKHLEKDEKIEQLEERLQSIEKILTLKP